MSGSDVLQLVVILTVLFLPAPFVGEWLARVFRGQPHFLQRIFGWLEKSIYGICGINPRDVQDWKGYSVALIAFNVIGLVFLFALQMLQGILPLNPGQVPGTSWDLAFNTAVSFVTNTNWQSYSGENMMSHLTQMLGLTVQNFVSAGTGIAVLLAFTRGLIGRQTRDLGNFWVDLTRSVVYVLLPICFVFAVVMVGQGVVQNFSAPVKATTVQGAEQVIATGPVASQIAIKQLGTNGGGFYNTNSAHPFENPSPFSNFLQLIAILFFPVAFPFMFGSMVGSRKQGLAIFAAMAVLLAAGLALSLYAEYQPHPMGALATMEGKETRFGVMNSVVWSVFTTAASNGSVNAMHSSLSPISGAVAMFNMMLGEIIFGGVGAGLYGMLLFVILTVFIAGLMVGRTPEYLGKKIEAREIRWAIIAVLAPSACVLIGSGISLVLPAGLAGRSAMGPHGLSEILYAFTSAANNNGSAFAGLNANTVYYNVMLGIAMLIGRFAVILPCLAIAGGLAMKKVSPPSPGTFATDQTLFVALLIGTILIVGGLTFFPVLALGPLIEHFLALSGQVF